MIAKISAAMTSVTTSNNYGLVVNSRSWYSEPNKNSSYSTSLSCWFEKFQVEIRIDLTKPSYRFEVTTDSIYTSFKRMSHR